MSIFDIFKRKETDLLNYAHTLAGDALGVFDHAQAELTKAQDVLARVKAEAIVEANKVQAEAAHEIAEINAWVEAETSHHFSRHDAASEAASHNAVVLSKITALTSPVPSPTSAEKVDA